MKPKIMSNVLITGASGFVGQSLIPLLLAQGHKVYGLSRHPPEARENLIPLTGDITEENLGLTKVPGDIYAAYHLAGIHRLGEDKDGEISRTNVLGTNNVISFCTKYKIAHLYFCSTAYTWDCNTYGLSKIRNEEAIARFAQETGAKTTIFKPSIIMGTEEHPYPGHFSQFVKTVVKIHHRAELIRKNIEGTLRLPAIEPVFRIKGDPDGKLNLVSVAAVVEAMAAIKKPGTYWLTNPNPPTLGQLVDWAGEFIMVKLRFEHDFQPMPLEIIFQRLASAFSPYLQGDDFPSDIKHHPPITREFIHETISQTLYPCH